MLKRLSYVIVALFFASTLYVEAKTVKILSLSGGGTRGIMEAEYLAQLEESTGKSIRSLFDVIVGTSTGGLIALLVSMPDENDPLKPKYTAREIVGIYKKISSDIFKVGLIGKIKNPFSLFRPKYDAEKLEKSIKKYIGEIKLENLIGYTGLTSVDTSNHSVILFDNLSNYRNLPAYVAARATSAAPSYFKAVKIKTINDPKGEKKYVDGGVLANTPVNEAIEFAKKIYDRSDVNFVLISLGTGSALSSAEALPAYFSYKKENGKIINVPLFEAKANEDVVEQRTKFYDFFMDGGLIKGGLGTVDFVFRAQTVQALKEASKKIGSENIIHVQFHLSKAYPLDTIKPSVLDEMREIAKRESYENRFNAIKGLLRRE